MSQETMHYCQVHGFYTWLFFTWHSKVSRSGIFVVPSFQFPGEILWMPIHRKSEALKLYRAFSEIGVDIHPSHTFKAHQSHKVVMWNLKIIAFKIKETLVLRNVYLFLFMANEWGIVGSSVISLCLDKIQFKLR